MRWYAISGSWRTVNEDVERDVRNAVCDIIHKKDGMISGGALGVDYIALDEAMIHDPQAQRIRIILPTPLDIFARHFFNRASEGAIISDQAEKLIEQLSDLKRRNANALIELGHTECNETSYYDRNSKVIDACTHLLAFQVNNSQGGQDAINKAVSMDKPVIHKQYTI